MERAWKAVGAAELARARGRTDPKLWVGRGSGVGRDLTPVPARVRAVARHRGARRRRRPRRGGRDGSARRSSSPATGRAVAGRRADRAGTAGAARARVSRSPTVAARRGGGRTAPARTRSASPRASVRCWRCSPRGRPTGRSARRCSWPRRRPASTSRGSSASLACVAVLKPRLWRTGCIWADRLGSVRFGRWAEPRWRRSRAGVDEQRDRAASPRPSAARPRRRRSASALRYGTVGAHRVPGVAAGDHPGLERDLLAGEAVRVAAAVPALVMGADDRSRPGA